MIVFGQNSHVPEMLISCTFNPPSGQPPLPRRQHPLREISFKLTVIIRELLHSDSLGSFLSLFLHICPLIQPASRPSISEHLSKQEVSFSPQIFLRSKETPTQSSFCILFLTNLFFLYYSFYRCLSFLVISLTHNSIIMSLFIFRKDI